MQFVWDIYDFVEQPLSLSQRLWQWWWDTGFFHTHKLRPCLTIEKRTKHSKAWLIFTRPILTRLIAHMYKSFCSPQLRGFLCCRKIMSTCSLVSDELCRCYKIDIPTHNKNTHTKKFRSTFTEWKPWTSYILKNMEQQSFIPQHKRGNGSENGLFWSWLGLWTLCCYYHTVIVSRP